MYIGRSLRSEFLRSGHIVTKSTSFCFPRKSWLLIGRIQCLRLVRAHVEPKRVAWRFVDFD